MYILLQPRLQDTLSLFKSNPESKPISTPVHSLQKPMQRHLTNTPLQLMMAVWFSSHHTAGYTDAQITWWTADIFSRWSLWGGETLLKFQAWVWSGVDAPRINDFAVKLVRDTPVHINEEKNECTLSVSGFFFFISQRWFDLIPCFKYSDVQFYLLTFSRCEIDVGCVFMLA